MISETITLRENVARPANKAADAVERLTAALRAAGGVSLGSGVSEQLAGIGKIANASNAASKVAAQVQVADAKAMHAQRLADIKAAIASEAADRKAASVSDVADKKAAAASALATQKASIAQESADRKAAAATAAAAKKTADAAALAAQKGNIAATAAAQKAAIAAASADQKAAIAAGASQQKAAQSAILAAQKASHARDMEDKKSALAMEKAKLDVIKQQSKERIAASKAAKSAKAAPAAKAAKADGGGGADGLLSNIFGSGGQFGSMMQQYAGVSAGAAGAMMAAATAIAATVREVVTAITGLVAAGAKMAVHAATFKFETMIGLKTMLGSQAAAGEAFKNIKKFADETPFETEFVTKMYKQLAAAGYKAAEIKDVLRGSFDVAALKGFSTEAAEGIVRGLLKVKSVGKLTSESLEQISVASGAIVNVQSLAETVAKTKNVSVEVAKQMIKGGKLGADEATKAILDTVKNKVSGGELGKLSKEMGEGTITGLTSTIAGMIPSLFEDINIQPIIDFMKQLVKLLDPGNDVGKGLKEGVESVYNGLFGMLFGGMEKGDVAKTMLTAIGDALKGIGGFIKDITPGVQGFVRGIMEGFNTMKPAIGGVTAGWAKFVGMAGTSESLWASVGRGIAYVAGALVLVAQVIGFVITGFTMLVGGLGAAIMAIVGVIDVIFGFVADVWSTLVAIPVMVLGAAIEIGEALTQGIAQGIGLDLVIAKIEGMGSAIVSTIRRILKVNSPSQVFEEIGGYTTEGMAQGIEGGTSGVTGSVKRMAGEVTATAAIAVPSAARAGAAEGGAANNNGGGGDTYNVTINANSAEGGKAAAEAFQRSMAEWKRRRVAQG